MISTNICVGLAAHVDAGKTTLSESILYKTGVLRKLGRVDHGDSLLDNLADERARGITIFSKQALFELGGKQYTLIDTPGHEDFRAELIRAMSAMDCCILVVSAARGICEQDAVLWKLLEKSRIPVIIFANKMDREDTDHDNFLRELKEAFGDEAAELTFTSDAYAGGDLTVHDAGANPVEAHGYAGHLLSPCSEEETAMLDEDLMEAYLSGRTIGIDDLRMLFRERKLIPCCFGSALRQQGVDQLLHLLEMLTDYKDCPDEPSARIYRISRDSRGRKILHIKVTGGHIRPRDSLRLNIDARSSCLRMDQGVPPDMRIGSGASAMVRADRIYIPDGRSLKQVDEVSAGMTAVLSGPGPAMAGDGLGNCPGAAWNYDISEILTENAVTKYIAAASGTACGAMPEGLGQGAKKVIAEGRPDTYSLYLRLWPLYEEMPETNMSYDFDNRAIRLGFTGKLQEEIFCSMAEERCQAEPELLDAADFYSDIELKRLEAERLMYESIYGTADDGGEYVGTDGYEAADGPEKPDREKNDAEEPDYLGEGLKRDRELEAIFMSTAGKNANKNKRKRETLSSGRRLMEETKRLQRDMPFVSIPDPLDHYVIVDGYNIIFAWEELKELAALSLEAARSMLCDMLSNYQGYKGMTLILVFDAYRVSGGSGSAEKHHNIYIVYTREAQTADAYIEKTVHDIAKNRRVTVVTNDNLEQTVIFGEGASRMTADELKRDMDSCSEEIYKTFLQKKSRLKNRMMISGGEKG